VTSINCTTRTTQVTSFRVLSSFIATDYLSDYHSHLSSVILHYSTVTVVWNQGLLNSAHTDFSSCKQHSYLASLRLRVFSYLGHTELKLAVADVNPIITYEGRTVLLPDWGVPMLRGIILCRHLQGSRR
jgi:hypothetical protein